MAKRFAGFTPEQLGKIDPSLKGMQSDEQEKIIAANPALAARVGKMTQMAQQRIGMAEGGFVDLESRLRAQRRGFTGAGQVMPQMKPRPDSPFAQVLTPDPTPPVQVAIQQPQMPTGQPATVAQPVAQPVTQPRVPQQQVPSHSHDGAGGTVSGGSMGGNPQQDESKRQERQEALQKGLMQIEMQYRTNKQNLMRSLTDRYGFNEGGDTTGGEDEKTPEEIAEEQRAEAEAAKAEALTSAGESAGDLTKTALESPETLVGDIDVATTTEEQKEEGEIAEGTGQAGEAETATVTTATGAPDVQAPVKPDAATVDATTVTSEVTDVLDKLTAATGKPSADALADAATMSPEELKSLGLTVEQIEEARRVEGAPTRKIETGELIEGSTVDMERVKKEVNFEAATGAPSSDATVQGQLTGLMEDFEGAAPPAWAAGAMRAAAAQMASRGLSSSSMAGQAIVQAAMESAIPIASQDAKTVASFEMQNLSNKQQSAMFAAQQRATFLGLEFNQEFQARVTNAAKISDVANMNFTAEQQIALENARMAQTVDITNLNAKNAKVMADAASMTQVDLANLNNRQQANVQAANAFLQMDMANLSNEQQTTVFAAQSQINAMLSDQAADNAAKQFNASSENQVNQFFSDLGARVQLANADQANAMSRFNAGEANALAQFNTSQANEREQFNSTNRLVVAQANAQWAQAYTTADNAATNEANRQEAQMQGQMTMNAYNATIQTYRDMMSYANTNSNNDADRATQIAIAKIGADASKYGADKAAQAAASEASASKSSGFWNAMGSWAGSAWG